MSRCECAGRAYAYIEQSGDLRLHLPLNAPERLLEDLRASIPAAARQEDPTGTRWRIRDPHARSALARVRRDYPALSVEGGC